jgi:hypothetical protein
VFLILISYSFLQVFGIKFHFEYSHRRVLESLQILMQKKKTANKISTKEGEGKISASSQRRRKNQCEGLHAAARRKLDAMRAGAYSVDSHPGRGLHAAARWARRRAGAARDRELGPRRWARDDPLGPRCWDLARSTTSTSPLLFRLRSDEVELGASGALSVWCSELMC